VFRFRSLKNCIGPKLYGALDLKNTPHAKKFEKIISAIAHEG